jgi:hypothetical protein
MTIGELVFWYACVFLVLLLAMAVLLLRQRSAGKTFSLRLDWRPTFACFKEKVPRGDFWLKIFIAAFIALAAGVVIVLFVLPYGTVVALGALSVTGATLAFGVSRLLA